MMLEISLESDAGQRVVQRLASPVLVGRASECDLRLRNWRVARHHARLYAGEAGVAIDDLGSLAGTLVGGKRIVHRSGLGPDDEVLIGNCLLRVRIIAEHGMAPVRCVQANAGTIERSAAGPAAEVATAESSAAYAGHADGASAAHAIGTPDALLPAAGAAPADANAAESLATVASAPTVVSPLAGMHADWRRRLHQRLLEAMDLRRRDVASMSDQALRAEADALVRELIAQAGAELPAELDARALRREVVDEAVGLGPLESLLADPDISEIMVNRYDELFVEEGGRLRRHPIVFSSEQAVLGVIERIVAPLGRRVDESSPMVDARLKDGSRVNAVIAPVALKGAAITIRKFPARRLRVDDLIAGGALNEAMAAFLQLCVRERRNIVVSGGTGSGKTTLLNILSNFIPSGERLVTIEDAAELRLHHAHLVALEARPANLEGRGAVSIRDLVRNALRMRPDRIIVGECRGAEALDMLQAMNTGHEGSLTTLHANTPRDALARLETMILMAGMDLPLAAIREQVAAGIDLIVQQSRSASGVRRITAIVEVAGIESGRIQLQQLFRYESAPEGGGFRGCGVVPAFYETWRQQGLVADNHWFFGASDGRADAGLPSREA